MKMMVGDNLGETQLQQLVDRQLVGDSARFRLLVQG